MASAWLPTSPGIVSAYTYDDADRITEVQPPSPASAISYDWDDNGNLVQGHLRVGLRRPHGRGNRELGHDHHPPGFTSSATGDQGVASTFTDFPQSAIGKPILSRESLAGGHPGEAGLAPLKERLQSFAEIRQRDGEVLQPVRVLHRLTEREHQMPVDLVLHEHERSRRRRRCKVADVRLRVVEKAGVFGDAVDQPQAEGLARVKAAAAPQHFERLRWPEQTRQYPAR